jgi:hypothetical protein
MRFHESVTWELMRRTYLHSTLTSAERSTATAHSTSGGLPDGRFDWKARLELRLDP